MYIVTKATMLQDFIVAAEDKGYSFERTVFFRTINAV